MTIGVISDTHGHLDPKIPALFKGVEHILHAGDIGYTSIILELENITPVTAVLGNNDAGLDFRDTEVIELAARKFLVHHIVDPRSPAEMLRCRLDHEKPDVVVFGHSHIPLHEQERGFQIFNPGSPTERRRAPSHTMGVAEIGGGAIELRHLEV